MNKFKAATTVLISLWLVSIVIFASPHHRLGPTFEEEVGPGSMMQVKPWAQLEFQSSEWFLLKNEVGELMAPISSGGKFELNWSSNGRWLHVVTGNATLTVTPSVEKGEAMVNMYVQNPHGKTIGLSLLTLFAAFAVWIFVMWIFSAWDRIENQYSK